MKPYKILEGDAQQLEAFEKLVADALEEGYNLAGELIVQPAGASAKFYQPMILDDSSDDDEEEWEIEEDWDDEDEQGYAS